MHPVSPEALLRSRVDQGRAKSRYFGRPWKKSPFPSSLYISILRSKMHWKIFYELCIRNERSTFPRVILFARLEWIVSIRNPLGAPSLICSGDSALLEFSEWVARESRKKEKGEREGEERHTDVKRNRFIVHLPIPVSDFDARRNGRTYRAVG